MAQKINTRAQEMVQPILVDGSLNHQETIYYGAKASVLGMISSPNKEAYTKWLDGSFTKSVRKISKPKLQGLLDGKTEIPDATIVLKDDGKVAAASAPPSYPFDMNKDVLRGRVAGLEQPRDGKFPQPPTGKDFGLIMINNSLIMSTGKTTAQVAHGWMAFMLKQKPLEKWSEEDEIPEMWIREINPSFLNQLTKAPVRIHDAGYTEIEPGSLTVVVV